MRQGRAVDIDLAGAVVLTDGGSGLFVTATGPHRRGDPLKPLFNLTCKFGESTMTGAKAKQIRKDLGYIGSIRALEVTHGENGWHPHVHSLFLFDRKLLPGEVASFRSYLFARWEGVLARHGFGQLHPIHGLDVRPIYDSSGLSQYVTAVDDGWGVGLELARSDLKYRGQTPMQLLGCWAFGGDLDARRLWKEYEAVTFGRRCIQWTPGLRRRLLPEVVECSDEELAQAEGDDDVLVAFTFGSEQWNVWCRAGEVANVLRYAELSVAFVLLLCGQVNSGRFHVES